MERRRFIRAFAGAVAAARFDAFAQPAGRVYRVGILRPNAPPKSGDGAVAEILLAAALGKLGYVEDELLSPVQEGREVGHAFVHLLDDPVGGLEEAATDRVVPDACGVDEEVVDAGARLGQGHEVGGAAQIVGLAASLHLVEK